MQRSEFRFLPDPLLGYVWGVTQASTSARCHLAAYMGTGEIHGHM